MKTRHPSFLTLLALVALPFATANLAIAEDDDERHELSAGEIVAFLKEKMPESLALLERMREEEGLAEYQEALELGAELVQEYREIRADDGAEEAEAFLAEERLEVRVIGLVYAWYDAEGDEAKRAGIRRELEELIAARVDAEIAEMRRELEELEGEVDEIAAEIREMESSRDEIIADEVREALSEDGEDWDDELDDGEDLDDELDDGEDLDDELEDELDGDDPGDGTGEGEED